MPKVLVIEDDAGLNRMIREWLVFSERHTVEYAENGSDGLDKLLCSDFDVIVLDWEMPGKSGIEVLKEYRSSGGKAPVLMLTGKGGIVDKEAGFDAGADDYLTKPFHMKELSARLRALIRRAGGTVSNVLQLRDISLDPGAFKVTRGGREIQLLPREFALLEFLMRHPDQVFSADTLLNRVWSSDSEATVDAITTCVKRIRKKMDSEGHPSIIKTVHGVGYKMESN
ncbi:MAG: response regulator transcription factor [Candidatus Obscuribacterales bacterium]|nr:response regulator transcription factor [Candidatus Obscuribacterales bacterium]